ncbi:MAG: FAD-dependent oxidoreductase [Treponema sp.]|nr:FAD-dependent oxidoreductase [Treponema sp.]
MKTDVTITILPSDEKNQKLINSLIAKELKKKNIKTADDMTSVFQKKSIDARHGQLKIHLRYTVYIGEKPSAEITEKNEFIPQWKKADGKHSVIIIGSGPAGLFGALTLLEKGIKPVIIERGCDTKNRKKDIARISTQGFVNANSNYCFGEGGAGTFSDGKLYTRSNKRGNIDQVLQIFTYFGADKKILTDAHPHIGTNKLPQIINNMRNKIIECGGEVHFNTKAVSLNNNCEVSCENTLSSEKTTLKGDAVVLATGHSAFDIYKMIAETAPKALEAKTFAAGVRVEHPRSLIDTIQYHGKKDENLGAAEYRVTTQVEERGVYSFCMCPGGFVVPSASGPDEIVVNGMSAAERNSKWSNAAIVVEIRPEDIPYEFVKKAKEDGCEALAGLYFRESIEKDCRKNGKGQAAPAQRLTDFLENKKSENLPDSSYTPGLVSSNLKDWLPEHISERLSQGFRNINNNMHGFISKDALLIAAETRTSTPVRILRDKETYESPAIKGLYPAGEGSGYSGGIVSSAMDGINACNALANKILK